MRRLLLALILLPLFISSVRAQESAFIGDWNVTLIKTKTKPYPSWFEIKYPIRMSFHQENGKLIGSYIDQYEFSDRFSILVVQGNEIFFVMGGAGKKYESNHMPVHRAILKNGVLHGYVFTDQKKFEWIARKRKGQLQTQVIPSSPCPPASDATFVDYRSIYRKYEVSQPAKLLSLPQPELTPEAIKNRATGKMVIEATLGPCGEVGNLVLRGSVRYGLTDRAVAAARKIKFKPAMENGHAVPQRIQLEYRFYLCKKAPICSRVREVVD
jgi:TonB family protein